MKNSLKAVGWAPGRYRKSGLAFAIELTGLDTDSLGLYAEIGNEASISYTITPDNGTDTVAWDDNSPNSGSDYGTGANPTSLAALSGGTLFCHVTDGGTTVTQSAPVRYAPGAFGALTSPQTFTEGTGDQTYVFSAATGANLTWTYSLVSPPTGVTIVSATRTITHDTDVLAVQAGTVITVRATDQYGRSIDRTYELTIESGTTGIGTWVVGSTFTIAA